MDDDEQVDLKEGMSVSNEEGEDLGTLAALLVAEDEEEAEFILLKSGADEHLVPFEAVLGVGDGALVVDITKEVLARYPRIAPGAEPSDDDVEEAYTIYDETARYSEE